MTTFQAYTVIADILSFKSASEPLKNTLRNPNFDWEPIVIHGSQHVVLPAIYIRLKQKNLLSILPEDLKNYLEEITNINRNRNISILKQVHVISKLFQAHKINHVFLKGTALLAAGYYTDLGERMIGDIDILVSEQQLEDANSLLISRNYKPIEQTFGAKYFEHKHLPRLVLENSLAAVELHKYLFKKGKKTILKRERVISSKQLINQVYVPDTNNLLHHCILNWQINDHGYYYSRISFRSSYDTILILNKAKGVLGTEEGNDRNVINFLVLASIYFKDTQHLIKGNRDYFKCIYYNFKQKHSSFSFFIEYLFRKLSFFNLFLSRLKIFIINKEYRQDVFADKKRIFKLLKK